MTDFNYKAKIDSEGPILVPTFGFLGPTLSVDKDLRMRLSNLLGPRTNLFKIDIKFYEFLMVLSKFSNSFGPLKRIIY